MKEKKVIEEEIEIEDDIFAATDVFNMAEKEMTNSKKRIYKKPTFWILSIMIVVLVVLIVQVVNWANGGVQTQRILDDIGEYQAQIEVIPPENEESATKYKVEAVDLTDMIDKNTDTIAYLQYSQFEIAYPVLQTNNNTYYLDYNFEKKQSKDGWIYMDYRNNVDDIGLQTNIVIFGHNMLNGNMFSPLSDIEEKDVKKEENRLIILQTVNNIYVYEVFSSYVTSVDFNYIQTEFKDSDEYAKFIKEIKKKNKLKGLNDISVDENDSILTLSTCSGSSDRRAIHAKLIDIQEK